MRALHLPRLQPHGGVRAPGELPAHVRHLRARDPPESAGVHLRQPSRGRDARAQKETGADGPDEEAEPGAAADGPSDYPPSAAPTLAPTLPDDAAAASPPDKAGPADNNFSFTGLGGRCEDSRKFKTHMGLSCRDHKNLNCLDIQSIGFTPKQMLQLLSNCPKTLINIAYTYPLIKTDNITN